MTITSLLFFRLSMIQKSKRCLMINDSDDEHDIFYINYDDDDGDRDVDKRHDKSDKDARNDGDSGSERTIVVDKAIDHI